MNRNISAPVKMSSVADVTKYVCGHPEVKPVYRSEEGGSSFAHAA